MTKHNQLKVQKCFLLRGKNSALVTVLVSFDGQLLQMVLGQYLKSDHKPTLLTIPSSPCTIIPQKSL